jgi:hypothetical protein
MAVPEGFTAIWVAFHDNFVENYAFVVYRLRKSLNIEVFAGTYLAIILPYEGGMHEELSENTNDTSRRPHISVCPGN